MSPELKVSREMAPGAPLVLADDGAFAAGLEGLAAIDPAFVARLDAVANRPTLRRRQPGFEGLAAIVVSQQVSTASADAIFAKVKAAFPDLHAGAVAGATQDTLRACGLSAAKQRTFRAVADAVSNGLLDFDALATGDADAARAALCAIKGIGPWTADVFLLFCLGNADAFPAGDLALQEGAKLALGLPERPDTKALEGIAERWRPLRGVAAHCLWAYYGAIRRRAATLDLASVATTDDTARTAPAAKPPRRTQRKP